MNANKTIGTRAQLIRFYALACLLFPGVLLLVLYMSSVAPELSARLVGTVLQLAGFLTVASTLVSKVDEVGERPDLWRRIRNLIYRVCMWFGIELERETVVKRWKDELEVSGYARLDKKASPGAGLEKRVEMLEKQQEQLASRIEKVRKRGRQERKQLEEDIDSVRSSVKKMGKKLRERDKHLAIGTIHLEFAALWWFILGTILTAFPSILPDMLA